MFTCNNNAYNGPPGLGPYTGEDIHGALLMTFMEGFVSYALALLCKLWLTVSSDCGFCGSSALDVSPSFQSLLASPFFPVRADLLYPQSG